MTMITPFANQVDVDRNIENVHAVVYHTQEEHAQQRDPLPPMMVVRPKPTAAMTSSSVPNGPYVASAVWTWED